DPSGHWVETAWDLFSIGLTLNDIRREGLTWQNGLALAVDVTTALLPGVPAFAGVAMKAGKAAVEVASHVDEAGILPASPEGMGRETLPSSGAKSGAGGCLGEMVRAGEVNGKHTLQLRRIVRCELLHPSYSESHFVYEKSHARTPTTALG
ncbi:MAG: hypothetical protein NZ553_05185, partial [Caldilinea sp.]|nr:hypothetical protein [Caldilinea sp.]MDW8439851.1 hypothetical protein [Caldilineaceae bacterium]